MSVDEYVSQLVIARLSRDDAADLLRPAPRPGVDARKLRADARKLRTRKASQMRLHAAGAIDDADLAEGMRAIRDRLAAIDIQLAATDEADPLTEFRAGEPAAEVWDRLGMARQRAVVQVLIGAVVIKRAGRKGQGFDPATVFYAWAPGA